MFLSHYPALPDIRRNIERISGQSGETVPIMDPKSRIENQENLIYELSVIAITKICLHANAKHISVEVKSLRLSQFKYTSFYKFLCFFCVFFCKDINQIILFSDKMK